MIRDFQKFEDFLFSKMALSTVEETIRKIRFLDKRTDLSSRDAILEFLRDERRSGAQPKTINEHIKILNRWLSFNKEDKLEYLHNNRGFTIKFYDEGEIRTMLSKLGNATVEDIRNRTMLLLALNTGLRRSEISDLKLEDVHTTSLIVRRGKGDKSRVVFLDANTRKVISDYLTRRNNQSSPYLFTTRSGKITSKYMGKVALSITEKTGIHFSWHKCRHTYAHNLVKEDVDLETVRQMLGHEDLGTTQIYAALDSGGAIERIRRKKPHFVKDSHGFKSPASCPRSNGLKGIDDFVPPFMVVRTWNIY